jgi:CRISPR locus-related DNA-binding protein
MAIIISTLGETAGIGKLGAILQLGPEKIIFITGRPWKEVLPPSEVKRDRPDINPIEIANKLKQEFIKEGLKDDDVKIYSVNQTDFLECTMKVIDSIEEAIKDHPDKQIYVNVTAGTKPLAIGALCASWIKGVKAFYIQEKGTSSEIVWLPILNVKYDVYISKEKKKILKYIQGKSPSGREIASHLNVMPQTITHHLKTLERDGLISSRIVGRKKLYTLTKSGLLYAYLFR